MKTLLLFSTLFVLTQCTKVRTCYDAKLEREMRGQMCTMDCPGVIGCDGKSYCNTCEMNKAGIPRTK
jgi:hypothetical protein